MSHISQEINCCVESCKHNEDSAKCRLSSIAVGKSATVQNQSRDTECSSFECC